MEAGFIVCPLQKSIYVGIHLKTTASINMN